MTTPDDDCVHLRDPLGRLWRRQMSSNTIYLAWAGAKGQRETSAAQDSAFKNCLKAASSLSESGYPQSIIAGLPNDVVYLAERHHIRCGNFPEYLAWKIPPTGGDFQLLWNIECNNNHSGYDAESEANLALIDVRSTSANGEVVLGEQAKLDGNTTNYVLRLANKNQLKNVLTRRTNFTRIRYTDDGSQSSFAMRYAPHPLQGTIVGRDASYSYPYKRPGKYSFKVTIPSTGGSFSVQINGFTIYEQDQVGIHRCVW